MHTHAQKSFPAMFDVTASITQDDDDDGDDSFGLFFLFLLFNILVPPLLCISFHMTVKFSQFPLPVLVTTTAYFTCPK